MQTREDLAKYFTELGYKTGAEIGVNWGRYSRILCEANQGLKLYSIDPWDLLGAGRNNLRVRRYERAKEYLADFDVTIVKNFSMDAVKDFENESLDFVYIDANHDFDNVMRDIIEWSPKVRSGGIVSGDDYDNVPGCGVRDAVDTYARYHHHDLNILPVPDGTWKTRAGADAQSKSWWFMK